MLHNKMTAVMADVNGNVAEREELVRCIAIALLTRKNLFVLGDSGQAKSYALDLFMKRITGARLFKRTLSKQTAESALFGQPDLNSMIPGGVPDAVLHNDSAYGKMTEALRLLMKNSSASYPPDEKLISTINQLTARMEAHRKSLSELHKGEPALLTKGKIPESDLVFLDELFKASEGLINSLLEATNEHTWTNEGRAVTIPVISFFSASNELPSPSNPEDHILLPLLDRFEIRVITEYVKNRDNRLTTLKKKQSNSNPPVLASITLEELAEMQKEVRDVEVPEAINILMDDILCKLREKEFPVTDRKYFGFTPFVQAAAWLEGKNRVEARHMLELKYYLWTKPEDFTAIAAMLEGMCKNPYGAELDSLRSSALQAYQNYEANVSASGGRGVGAHLLSLRTALIGMFDKANLLLSQAATEEDKARISGLISDLEEQNRKASQAAAFTPVGLTELKEMQEAEKRKGAA